MSQIQLPTSDYPAIFTAFAPRHRWDNDEERRIAGIDSHDGHARNVKFCRNCGFARITVMPMYGAPWHEWRTPEGAVWLGETADPVCGGGE